MLSDCRDSLGAAGNKFEFWLSVDAYEYLQDNPCLPIDPHNSGMQEVIDRTTKSRLDQAFAAAGLYVNKAISFAWDSDFVCMPNGYNTSLADDILRGYQTPILMYCNWHSYSNMSVVVIGHSLAGRYNVTYQIREGPTKLFNLYTSYVESAWGPEHNRLASLTYNQLSNVPDPYDVSRNGTVTVLADGNTKPCIFTYDYRNYTDILEGG